MSIHSVIAQLQKISMAWSKSESALKVKDMPGFRRSFYSHMEKGNAEQAYRNLQYYGMLVHRAPARASTLYPEMVKEFDAKFPGYRARQRDLDR